MGTPLTFLSHSTPNLVHGTVSQHSIRINLDILSVSGMKDAIANKSTLQFRSTCNDSRPSVPLTTRSITTLPRPTGTSQLEDQFYHDLIATNWSVSPKCAYEYEKRQDQAQRRSCGSLSCPRVHRPASAESPPRWRDSDLCDCY